MSSSPQPRWLDADEQRAWRAYLRGSRLLEAALDRDLQEHGVSLSEYEILSMLSEASGQRLRMSEIAALVVQSRSRLTHTAGRLEQRGLVAREPSRNDRRGVELVLTEEGARQITALAAAHVESVRAHLLDHLSPPRFRALGRAMAAVRDGLERDLAGRDRSPPSAQ